MTTNLTEPGDSLPKLVSELLRFLSDWPEFDDWERRLARLSTAAAPSPEGLREAAEEMVAAWRDAETDLTTNRMDIAAKRLWAALDPTYAQGLRDAGYLVDKADEEVK